MTSPGDIFLSYAPDSLHWNNVGHARAASALADYLLQNRNALFGTV
jgi:hypothetical protein